ncbi:uncharacterized protein DDB_G0283697 [Episyrphus balteatus]|uniref:uncharacterized protein DDB_G0283697 n=1 Tax=Episyrphus balteatus TaxID=286459 RepID=UPI0024860412|nr:uncharacterized protein DDB_G0283697 [Episyrphus balteatus]
MNKDLKSKEDASPLTTSTESETFDTWTVITDKTTDLIPQEIPSPPPTPEKVDEEDEEDEIAEDAVRVEVFKATDDQLENRYNDIDDLSDGISIISECESVGRISPHPELRKHLSELNMRFVEVIPPSLRMTNSAGSDSTSRNYEASSEHSSDVFHQVEPLLENNRRPRRSSCQLTDTSDFQPTLRSGLRGLFYVGALLGVLAFISKLKYESVHGTNTDVLNQKINDLELKNNLMRAEIDILAKQVNYLTTLSENKKYSSSSSNKPKSNPSSKEKKVKVWPGNGNIIEEVEVNPKEFKTPYKCDGHNNVDIAGMCIELPKTSENVVDSLGEKVRTVIEENEHFANFEKIVDKVVKMTENPFGEKVDKPREAPDSERVNPKEYQPKKNDYTPHEHKPDKYEGKKYDNEGKKYDNEGKKYDNKRESFKKHKKNDDDDDDDSGESKERYRRDRSSEDFNGSGERYKKSKDYKKYDKYSSSEYENAKRDADGQWHEKLMQHRENARKNSDKHRHDKNWYIERGDSREQARVTEQKYR